MLMQIAVFDWSRLLKPETLIFIMAGVVAVSAIVLAHWSRVREVEAASRLKQKMIDRGFSADEIERVLNAGGDEEASERS